MSNPQPEATMLTSFSDLPTVAPDRTYIIAFNYEGAPYKIEVRKLALEEYYQHDHDEPFPKPPTRPSRDGLQPDYDSPKWDIAMRDRLTRVNVRRLAASCIADIPGGNITAKVDWLYKRFPPGLLGRLAVEIERLNGEGEAQLEQRVDSFRSTEIGADNSQAAAAAG